MQRLLNQVPINNIISQQWLSTKNRSPWSSTSRHPIDMVSTTNPPDPMPCALAAILLAESRAHGCHMQKTMFPGPDLRVCDSVRPRAVPACGVRKCGVGESLESGQRHGCREAVPDTTGGRLPLVWSPSQRIVHVKTVCVGYIHLPELLYGPCG